MIKILLMIGSGSFFGGISRYLLTRFIQNSHESSFPFGTFLVNIGGCFLIGLIFGLSERGNIISPQWRMFFAMGFCGSFTTFSAFTNQNLNMLKDGNFIYFALYTSLSIFFGLLATYSGNLITKIV